MRFKPSVGIFVGGLASTFGGAVLFLLVATGGDGGESMFMGLIGILVCIAGIVMLCVGAARALAIIDALPAAFRNLDRQSPYGQAPQPPHQTNWQQPHIQPPGPAHTPPPRYEQQPPVQ
jgi:predicted lipid-binding transport protein (Tim44 family)